MVEVLCEPVSVLEDVDPHNTKSKERTSHERFTDLP